MDGRGSAFGPFAFPRTEIRSSGPAADLRRTENRSSDPAPGVERIEVDPGRRLCEPAFRLFKQDAMFRDVQAGFLQIPIEPLTHAREPTRSTVFEQGASPARPRTSLRARLRRWPSGFRARRPRSRSWRWGPLCGRYQPDSPPIARRASHFRPRVANRRPGPYSVAYEE